jgi:hypothetical protein
MFYIVAITVYTQRNKFIFYIVLFVELESRKKEKMDKYCFHSEAVSIFRDEIYSDIFTKWDISGEEKEIKEKLPETTTEDSNGNKKTIVPTMPHKGFEIRDRKTKKTYFLESKVGDTDQYITEVMPIKIKQTKELVYGRKVYHLVTKWISVKFEPTSNMSFRDWFDVWFPLEHTSEDDKMVAKFCVLASAIGRGFSRLVTGAGFGKDGMANNLINVVGKGRNVSTASKAKLFQLISEDFTVFNEIGGLGGDNKVTMQDFFLQTGDVGNAVYEHSTTGSDKTSSQADITKYGWCIFHNLPEYYMDKGLECFEQMFSHAVFDRVFPLLLDGAVESKHSFMNVNIDFKRLVKESKNDYRHWIGCYYRMKEGFNNIQLKYKLDRYELQVEGRKESASRYYNTFYRLAKLVQEYSETEEEFYTIMDKIYARHKKYIGMVKELGLI